MNSARTDLSTLKPLDCRWGNFRDWNSWQIVFNPRSCFTIRGANDISYLTFLASWCLLTNLTSGREKPSEQTFCWSVVWRMNYCTTDPRVEFTHQTVLSVDRNSAPKSRPNFSFIISTNPSVYHQTVSCTLELFLQSSFQFTLSVPISYHSRGPKCSFRMLAQ